MEREGFFTNTLLALYNIYIYIYIESHQVNSTGARSGRAPGKEG